MTTPGAFTVGQVLTAADMNEFGAWLTYTPTWTNVTVGNGTVTARYYAMQSIGFLEINFVWGSTTSASGLWQFSMPSGWTATNATPSQVAVITAAGTQYFGYIQPTAAASSTMHVRVLNAAGTYAQFTNVTGTVPGSFVSGDSLRATWIGRLS